MSRSSARPSSAVFTALAIAALAVVVSLAMRERSRAHDRALAAVASAAGPDAAPPILVELSGCAAVLAGAICEVPADGAIRAWVSAPPGAVTFTSPAGSVGSSALAQAQGGTLHRLVLPADARELRVVSSNGAVASPRVAPRSAPAWVERVKALRQAGKTEEALALLSAPDASRTAIDRAFAQGLRGRIELAAGRTEASFSLLRDAARLHREVGRSSDAADDSFALAFALNQRSFRYAEARKVLDEARADITDYPDGRVREAYYRGTLATETGDARAALSLLREARDRASRLGLAVLERNAINAYALQLELVGRTSEALTLLADVEKRVTSAGDVSACEKMEIAINTGFGALLANEQREGKGTPVDAVGPLTRAVALSAQGCSDRYLRTAALGNLALAALQGGDAAAARAHLAQARAGVQDAREAEVLFWHELDGRIALAEGQAPRAIVAFEAEAARARSTRAYDAEWRARVGKAMALEQLRRDSEAAAEYRAADHLVTALSLLVPLGEGRGTFVGDRGRSAKAAVEILARLGRAEEALAVARSSRARVVTALAHRARVEGLGTDDRARWEASLGTFRGARAALDAEARDDWRLPRLEAARARAAREAREAELRAALDAAFARFAGARSADETLRLPPLPPAALTVAFHPVRRGWVGLAADHSGVTSFTIPSLPPASDLPALAEALLVPIRGRLEHATLLRVLPFGALRGVAFHALPYEGKPLVARVAIEYPLDLPELTTGGSGAPEAPGGSGAAGAPEARTRALVIADPTLDLVGTRGETDHVVRAMRDAGSYEVDVLEGPRATSEAILPLLRNAKLLHYAGHGVFAGREGWQSALPLAAGGHLTIGDILASTAVPKRVVLSGCETARTSDDASAEALGLAQAFVVAGADFVIAPTRPVDDALAARMSAALYGMLAGSAAVDAAAALRQAQLRLHAEDPALDWSAFRTVSR